MKHNKFSQVILPATLVVCGVAIAFASHHASSATRYSADGQFDGLYFTRNTPRESQVQAQRIREQRELLRQAEERMRQRIEERLENMRRDSLDVKSKDSAHTQTQSNRQAGNTLALQDLSGRQLQALSDDQLIQIIHRESNTKTESSTEPSKSITKETQDMAQLTRSVTPDQFNHASTQLQFSNTQKLNFLKIADQDTTSIEFLMPIDQNRTCRIRVQNPIHSDGKASEELMAKLQTAHLLIERDTPVRLSTMAAEFIAPKVKTQPDVSSGSRRSLNHNQNHPTVFGAQPVADVGAMMIAGSIEGKAVIHMENGAQIQTEMKSLACDIPHAHIAAFMNFGFHSVPEITQNIMHRGVAAAEPMHRGLSGSQQYHQ